MEKIKQEEVRTTLLKLKKMKTAIDENNGSVMMNRHFNHDFRRSIKNLGYFRCIKLGNNPEWKCMIEDFEPYHARKVMEGVEKRREQHSKEYKKIYKKRIDNIKSVEEQKQKDSHTEKTILNPKKKYRVIPVFKDGIIFSFFKLQYKSFLKWRDVGIASKTKPGLLTKIETEGIAIKNK